MVIINSSLDLHTYQVAKNNKVFGIYIYFKVHGCSHSQINQSENDKLLATSKDLKHLEGNSICTPTLQISTEVVTTPITRTDMLSILHSLFHVAVSSCRTPTLLLVLEISMLIPHTGVKSSTLTYVQYIN